MVPGLILPLEGGGSPIVFQWRPEEIGESWAANWVPMKVAGRELPYQQYSNGDEDILEFDLRFTSQGDPSYVKEMLKKVRELLKPTVQGAGMARPPLVQVILGDDIHDTYVLQSASTRKHTWADQMLRWYFGDAHLKLSRYQG